MSYDVSIGNFDRNMTWNVSQLFYDHIPADREHGGLSEIHGLTGKQALAVLGAAFDKIDNTRHEYWTTDAVGDPEFCALCDAKSGWGSTVGGLVFLAQIMGACALNPHKKVSVS